MQPSEFRITNQDWFVFLTVICFDIQMFKYSNSSYLPSVSTSLDPVPYLVAEYVAANICSTLLYIGNPTNIIVAQAYQMTFLGYMKWSVLPTVGELATSCRGEGLRSEYPAIDPRVFCA